MSVVTFSDYNVCANTVSEIAGMSSVKKLSRRAY